jgi:hypothetical protein
MTRRRTAVVGLCAVLALAATPVRADALHDFARCLTHAGATFYTAAWCPHCARQSRLFGDAIRYLRVVDCTNGCAGIGTFPTWTFANGSRITGLASLDALAARTGCRMAHGEGREPDVTRSAGDSGTRRRDASGVMIIEVPRR